MIPAETRIHRLRMRGRRGDLARARGPFLSGLDRVPWPDTAEVLHFRSLRLQGRGGELVGLLAEAVARMRTEAPSGWSASAEAAPAVRFTHARDRRACLLRDLLMEQAGHRWFWSTHPALAQDSLAKALHAVLLEAPLELPDLVERATAAHPHLRERLWKTLHPGQAEELLIRVAEAAGWSPGVWTALAFLRESTPPDAAPSAPPFGEVLSALVEEWPRLARHLGSSRGGALLAEACRRRTAGAPSLEAAAPFQESGSRAHATAPPVLQGSNPQERTERVAPLPLQPSLHPLRRELPPGRAGHEGSPGFEPKAHGIIDLETEGQAVGLGVAFGVRPDPPAPLQAPGAVGEIGPEPRNGFLTVQGGWFYLLNLLGPQRPEGSLEDLIFLGLALGLEPDEPLRDFFCEACEQPWTDFLGREVPEDLDDLLALGRKRYGSALDEPGTFVLRARVLVTSCHLDVHFPAEAAQLSVRRVGLDVNPGWLPWLGRTVTFHYGTPEAPR